MEKTAINIIRDTCEDLDNSVAEALEEILSNPSSVGRSGFPVIQEKSFQLFLDKVPHLFRDGNRLVGILDRMKEKFSTSAEVTDESKKINFWNN